MAYKIQYQAKAVRETKGHKKRFALLTICFFALFLLAAHRLVPSQLQQLRQLVFPSHHVEALLQDLQEGEGFIAAVTTFCKEIVNGN